MRGKAVRTGSGLLLAALLCIAGQAAAAQAGGDAPRHGYAVVTVSLPTASPSTRA